MLFQPEFCNISLQCSKVEETSLSVPAFVKFSMFSQLEDPSMLSVVLAEEACLYL